MIDGGHLGNECKNAMGLYVIVQLFVQIKGDWV